MNATDQQEKRQEQEDGEAGTADEKVSEGVVQAASKRDVKAEAAMGRDAGA